MPYFKAHSDQIIKAICLSLVCVFISACAAKKVEPDGPTQAEIIEAEKQAQEALKLEQSAKEMLSSAIADMAEENWEQAAKKLDLLHLEQPTLAAPLFNLGVVSAKQGQWDEAKSFFEQALSLKPDSKEALNYLGVVARQQGQFAEAEGYYRQALELDPNYADAQLNLAIVLDLYMGRLAEALALYEAYQGAQAEPDRQVKDWIFDLKNRL